MNALAVALGAALGALFRYGLGLALTSEGALIPLGTFAANALGGLLIGSFFGFFGPEGTPPWVRHLLVTGFLGGLTTFSTFSAEALAHLQKGAYPAFAILVSSHLAASIGLAWLGYALGSALR